MEPSKEAIIVRLTRLNRQIAGKLTSNTNTYTKRNIDRETLLDALTVLYDECNEDCVKKGDVHIRGFLDKYRSALAELRRTRVCISDFEMLQMIGKGHFGEVHMVREKHTGDVYALKTLRKESALSRKGIACYEEERDILAAAASPWLVRLQYAFQDHNNLYLTMELCSGGDLAGLLTRRAQPFSESDAAFYVAEVAHALKALHSLGYVHRDIKPQNILLDRCGHVKLCDFGSACRLSEGVACSGAGATADYVAPELLAAAVCTHTACRHYCTKLLADAVAACDYWSLGVVAFELVTLRKPFSESDDESMACTLANIQKYEHQDEPNLPFPPLPADPSPEWRTLVTGLLKVQPAKRFHYLDTLQHPSLKHLSPHSIRDQVPPWMPCVRGPEDGSHFPRVLRTPPPPDAAPFRNKAPFAGQLPFIGFSFVAQEETEDHSVGFSNSHDCTAIDLATFKSAEKLAALRGTELSRVQQQLAAAESRVLAADSRAEEVKALAKDELDDAKAVIKRLEKDFQTEKEEKRSIEKLYNDLKSLTKDRTSSELKAATSRTEQLERENSVLTEQCTRLENRVREMEAELERERMSADSARKQQEHYKDSIAKERALRRQTLTGGQMEMRDAVNKIAVAESNAMREARAKAEAERKLVEEQHVNSKLREEIEELKKEIEKIRQDSISIKQSNNETIAKEISELKSLLSQERSKSKTFSVHVQELQRSIEEAKNREIALEEQRERTDSRYKLQLQAADAAAADALSSDARHREKVTTLEVLVKQLEREVSALETRGTTLIDPKRDESRSDTESVSETDVVDVASQAQVGLLREQLEKAEKLLLSRGEEIAALKQEARTANLARWRKERELTDLQSETKSNQRELKRLEERLALATESRRKAELSTTSLKTELEVVKPELEAVKKELAALKEKLQNVMKINETYEVEVDRSRNDIKKLKSELQYSEKRRIHAETQEEIGAHERATLRDEAHELKTENNLLVQNNKALQEACSLMEEQLTDLEKLSDMNELKNKELENEVQRLREDISECKTKLLESDRGASELRSISAIKDKMLQDAVDDVNHKQRLITSLQDRLETAENRATELEDVLSSTDNERSRSEAAVKSVRERLRSVMEESADLRTRNHQLHADLLKLQTELITVKEELSASKGEIEAVTAWWKVRESKTTATLKQHTKLVDFLQAKLEQVSRTKPSITDKLFGLKAKRSIKLSDVSSPRVKKSHCEFPTPKKAKPTNGILSIDTPDCPAVDSSATLELLRSDGKRERVSARLDNGSLRLTDDRSTQSASLHHHIVSEPELTKEELSRSFSIKVKTSENGANTQMTAICNNADERSRLLRHLAPPVTAGYAPSCVASLQESPNCVLYLDEESVAIGCTNGIHSLHGPINLHTATGSDVTGEVTALATVASRVLLICKGVLYHTGLLALNSALRRASNLSPNVVVQEVDVPDTGAVTTVQVISGEIRHGICAVAACGRRVFLLKHDPTNTDIKVARSITVDRPPNSLLLTSLNLYIAGEKPLKITLPNGTLESFALDDPTIQAAHRKRLRPKAILHINETELLICYTECAVFINENGKRTRSEDAKWTTSYIHWSYLNPFLYSIGKDSINISYINEESYKLPPCTCDNHSIASTNSECAVPRSHCLSINDIHFIGYSPNGILVRSRNFNEFKILCIDGLSALRSIGASVESLDSVSGRASIASSTDNNDCSNQSEPNTNFLADIRKKAAQLRNKPQDQEVLKEILNAELGPRKSSFGRKSPTGISEFSTDSESTGSSNEDKNTADICGDMFAKQVRFNK